MIIKNLIRKGTITNIYNRFGIVRAQVVALNAGEPEDVVLLNNYGMNSCPPIGSQCVILAINGYLEDKYAIPFNIDLAPRLQAGESVLYDAFGNAIYLKENGNIDISTSKASISGDLNTDGVYMVDNVQVVSSQGAAVVDAADGIVIDIQARTAINTLLARLRVHGLIQT